MNVSIAEFAQRYITAKKRPTETVALQSAVLKLLYDANMGPDDVRMIHKNGMQLALTQDGLEKLEEFLEEKGAKDIQRVWKGYKVRKEVKAMRIAKVTKELAQEEKTVAYSFSKARKLLALRDHILKVSSAYYAILNNPNLANAARQDPAPEETEFLGLLNAPETFKASAYVERILKLLKSEEEFLVPEPDSLYENGKSPFKSFTKLCIVLQDDFEGEESLLELVRSGDILCKLACVLFPKVKCQLLSKGPEFTIHKHVFFLELCKTVGLRPDAICTLADLTLGQFVNNSFVGPLTILRTIVALEKQGRRKGWKGLELDLSSDAENRLKEDDWSADSATSGSTLDYTAPEKIHRVDGKELRLSPEEIEKKITENSSYNNNNNHQQESSTKTERKVVPIAEFRETRPTLERREFKPKSPNLENKKRGLQRVDKKLPVPDSSITLESLLDSTEEYENTRKLVKEDPDEFEDGALTEKLTLEQLMARGSARGNKERQSVHDRVTLLESLLKTEDEYSKKLTKLHDLLELISLKRKRVSEQVKQYIEGAVEGTTEDAPVNLAKFSLESEDLRTFTAGLASILHEHEMLLMSLQSCLHERTYSRVGSVLYRFADIVHKSYITYAISVLGDASDSAQVLYDKGMEDANDLLSVITEKWINPGKDTLTPEQWRDFLKFPLERALWIRDELKTFVERETVWKNDQKMLYMAFIKFEGLHLAIEPMLIVKLGENATN